MDDLIPPHDIATEACVLGSMMLDSAAVEQARTILRGEDFYRPAHQTIFSAIMDLHQAQEPVDLVSVKNRLVGSGQFDAIGGMEYLAALGEGVPSAANAIYYCDQVRNFAIRRNMISLATSLTREAYAADGNAKELLAKYQQAIYELDDRIKPRRSSEMQAHEAAAAVLRDAEARYLDGNRPIRRVLSGLAALDEAIHGLRNGHLTVLAGAPGCGKTTFAMNTAWRVAATGGACMMVSAEMPVEELGQRLLQAAAKVSGSRLIEGRLEPQHWTKLALAEAELEQSKIYLVGRSMDLPGIVLKARQVAAKWGRKIDLIIVDYLQIMRLPPSRDLRESIGAMTSGLKQAAMELDCCVLLLSQLTREENKKKGPPSMFGLRESGAIEADANEVLLLYKPEPIITHDDTDGKRFVEVWLQVAKCRDGSQTAWPNRDNPNEHEIKLKWFPQYTLFCPMG